jgi:hypothetical protein
MNVYVQGGSMQSASMRLGGRAGPSGSFGVKGDQGLGSFYNGGTPDGTTSTPPAISHNGINGNGSHRTLSPPPPSGSPYHQQYNAG